MTAKPSARPRTVFMIVAHNNPALFGRLVARLKAPWTHVVALIDAKADQRVFEDAAKGAEVTFLPDDQRVDVQWAAMRALSLVPRKPLPGLPLYHGCGWWCLTRDAASWILDYFAQHPQVLSWLRHANCPDEIFIQTLLKASPYASSIAQDMTLPRPDQPGATLHGCHFIDWSDTRSSSPKLLDLDDLPALRASTALFARKIDPHRSEGLLDALDRAVAQPVS